MTQALLTAAAAVFVLAGGSARAAVVSAVPVSPAKPVCLEEFCLFDSVSKYPEIFTKKDYTGGPAVKPVPVCQPHRANLFLSRPDGSKVTLSFDSRANAPQGEHYWLTQVEIVYKGNYTNAQRKEAVVKLRDRFGLFQLGEDNATQFKGEPWRGITVGVNTSLPDLHVQLRYNTSTQEREAQRSQAGCASTLPRM